MKDEDSGYLTKPSTNLGVVQSSLFGISIVISGFMVYWAPGLETGYYAFLAGTLFIASGYVVLMLCLAEITSAVPFSGKFLAQCGTPGF